jgi:hypothetical protein
MNRYFSWQICVVASPTPWPQSSRASILFMTIPYTRSGKFGNTVWQRARYGQICYPAFIPFNPRSPAQCVVRGNLGAVSARWRTLTQDQRHVWIAVASTKKSRPRLGCGPLTGFNYFVKINVALANRGQPQLDLPPEYLQSPLGARTFLSASTARRPHTIPPGQPAHWSLARCPLQVPGPCASPNLTSSSAFSI